MNKLGVLAVSLISAGVASLVTAKVVEQKLLKEFDERLDRELAASVDFLERTERAVPTEKFKDDHKKPETFDIVNPAMNEDAATQNQRTRYDRVLKSNGYSEDETPPEGEASEEDDLGEIHTISTDEFMENESGYLQATLTYCADGVVLDEQGDPVIHGEVVDMIGDAVPPFGVESGEEHVVYLRNMKMRREFEVIREEENGADILAETGRVT